MFVRSELKSQAKAIIKDKYFTMVLVGLVALFLTSSLLGVSYDVENEIAMVTVFQAYSFYVNYDRAIMMAVPVVLIGLLWMFFVTLPASVGITCFFQRASFNEQKFSDVWSGFTINYAHKIKTRSLVWFRVFLWSMLLVVPGIMKALSYAFVPYLLNDYPEKSPKEILDMSEKMAKGMRWQMVVLWLSFFLWGLGAGFVDVFIPGFGTLLLLPYIYQTEAQLYHWAKTNRLNTNEESEILIDDESNTI